MVLDMKLMVLFFQHWVTDNPFYRHLLNGIVKRMFESLGWFDL